MKSLFGDNRLANILAIMRKSSVTDLHLLASQLSVSIRTIRNDIKVINEKFGNSSVIEVDQGRCSLRIFDEKEFHRIYSEILNTDDFLNSASNRRSYIFGRLMRSVEPVLTDDLAYEMNVGRSTLVKDLKALRNEISDWSLSIIGLTSKGLMLSGEEMNIRRYVLENNFDEIYKDYPQDEVVLQYESEAFSHQPFDSKVEENFDRYLTLMIDRFMTGHYIGRLPDKYYNLTARKNFSFVDHLLNQLGNRLHIDFPIEEKIFIFIPIVGMRKPDDTEMLSQIELDDSIRPLLDSIMSAIRDEMDLDLDLDGYTEEFMYHLMFMINRLRFNVHIDNPMADAVIEKYPVAAKTAEVAARVVGKECHVTVTHEELGYLTSYFSIFIDESMKQEPQSIAIVCGTGRVAARLIYAQLRRIIDSTTKVDMYMYDEISRAILDRYDIVLTTVDLPMKTSAQVIYIHEIFNEEELRTRIRKAKYLPHGKNTPIDDNWFVMTTILDPDKFFVLRGYDSYEAALQHMVSSLQEKGELDEEFGERLIKREEEGTMAVGDGAAIPHAINKAQKRMILAIGVLPDPVTYKGQEIRIIFLMGLPEKTNNDELLVRIYDEILAILNDKELFDRITAADSYPNLLRVLYKRL
ncbi:MAG: PTS sugar transporter subunit IIA [Eubacteriales bacterium]|jgi:lichenan operon transcriptional antiterminator